jgi:nucleotide-binding universal stress UspA family protein
MSERSKSEGTQGGVVAVGVDFTPASSAALDRAKQLAKATRSPLLLIHIVSEHSVVQVVRPGEWTSSSVIPAATPEGKAALKAAAVLAEQRLESGMDGIDSQAVVRAGEVYAALAETAETRGARLLVLGVRAPLAPAETFFLGTTAERALRHGATPVLLARRKSATPYRRVLLPLEPGDLSLRVLRVVAGLLPDAVYDVVHFLSPRGPHEARSATHRDAVVAALTGLCAGAGLDPERTHVRAFVAEPRAGILGEVKSRNPDLVAMGTHARSGLARVVIGSVADYAIHAATGVDVLVVPPESSHGPKAKQHRAAAAAPTPHEAAST